VLALSHFQSSLGAFLAFWRFWILNRCLIQGHFSNILLYYIPLDGVLSIIFFWMKWWNLIKNHVSAFTSWTPIVNGAKLLW
jgi:hypothetical protein